MISRTEPGLKHQPLQPDHPFTEQSESGVQGNRSRHRY